MSLFETILCKNRKLENLFFHNKRLNESRLELFLCNDDIKLEEHIQIPDWVGDGIYRCRVDYSEKITNINFFEYKYKKPKRIKIIEDASIEYDLKYSNREVFDKHLLENPDFDDVIFLQNGLITDSTYTNIAFFDGKNWQTPKSFLLNGTKRQSLLEQKLLRVNKISFHEISKFSKIAFINAMRDLDLSYSFEHKADELILE